METRDKAGNSAKFTPGRVAALLVLLVSQLTDCYTTLVGLESGFKEANPTVRYLISSHGYVVFFAVKVLFALYCYLVSRGYLRYALYLSLSGFLPGFSNVVKLFRLDIPLLPATLDFFISGVVGHVFNGVLFVLAYYGAQGRKQEEIRKNTPPKFAAYIDVTCDVCNATYQIGFNGPGRYGDWGNIVSFSSKKQVMSLVQERRCKEHSVIYSEFLKERAQKTSR